MSEEDEDQIRHKHSRNGEEQQYSVEEVAVPAQTEIGVAEPDICMGTIPANGTEIQAIALSVMELGQAFDQLRTLYGRLAEESRKNYPRIEVLVHKNCLITYTGPMNDFDEEWFESLVQQAIDGRKEIAGIEPVPVEPRPEDPSYQ